jgi:hypothetical protein
MDRDLDDSHFLRGMEYKIQRSEHTFTFWPEM